MNTKEKELIHKTKNVGNCRYLKGEEKKKKKDGLKRIKVSNKF